MFNNHLINLYNLKNEILISIWQTLIMVSFSTIVSVILGTTIGIIIFITSKKQIKENYFINTILNQLVNFTRSFPFVILMVALIPIIRIIIGTGIGPYATSIILSVSGTFYFSRLVEQNLLEIPKETIEAAKILGANTLTIIKVLISEIRSSIILSITTLTISLLSYSAAAGMIGGGGLGDLGIRYGYYRFQVEVLILIILILTFLVIIIQALGSYLANKLNKH